MLSRYHQASISLSGARRGNVGACWGCGTTTWRCILGVCLLEMELLDQSSYIRSDLYTPDLLGRAQSQDKNVGWHESYRLVWKLFHLGFYSHAAPWVGLWRRDVRVELSSSNLLDCVWSIVLRAVYLQRETPCKVPSGTPRCLFPGL